MSLLFSFMCKMLGCRYTTSPHMFSGESELAFNRARNKVSFFWQFLSSGFSSLAFCTVFSYIFLNKQAHTGGGFTNLWGFLHEEKCLQVAYLGQCTEKCRQLNLVVWLFPPSGESTSVWLWLLCLWTSSSWPCRSDHWKGTKGTFSQLHLVWT